MREILLIGNGPSILSEQVGHIIDTYPLICRFNSFLIEGYEKYTGMRTDIWITCLMDEVIKLKYLKYNKIYFPLAQQRFLDLEKIIPNSECFPKHIYSNAASFNDGHWFYPSSGLMASLFFIEKGYDVIIHGFDFFQTNRHHYCDDQQMGTNHSPNMELMAFTKLIKESKVRMLQ